jgi:RNA polymerase sigma factor (sigma-70 family)
MAAVPTIGRASRVEGAAAPEAEATRELYEQHAAQIFRYCLHQLGSREEAEDAVQSTFLNAFRGLKRGVVPELESAWLFKIAHNVCLSRRRSSWRRGRIEAPTDFDVVEELAPAPSRRSDELIGLQDALEQMPEQQRRAILLREWQGLSYREISEELDLSQAAVETLIFRARRTLAQGLEEPASVPKKRRRLGAGLFANLVSSGQSLLFGGGAAVKVAATVAVVSAGTVVATAPVVPHLRPAAPARTTPARPTHHVRAPQRQAPAPVMPAVAQHAPAPPTVHRAVPQRHVKAVHRAPAPTTVAAAPTAPPVQSVAPPAAPGPQSDAPGQVEKQDAAGSTRAHGHGRAAAPGQQKKLQQQDQQPQQTAPAEHGHGHGNPDAPGQQKKQQEQQDAPPAQTTPTSTLPVDPTSVLPASVPTDGGVVVQTPAAEHGRGNG